jgi:hypothetical protein
VGQTALAFGQSRHGFLQGGQLTGLRPHRLE